MLMMRSVCFLFAWTTLLLNGLACGPSSTFDSPQTVPSVHLDRDLQPFLESYLEDAARAGVPVQERYLKELRRVEWADESSSSELHDVKLGRCQRINSNSQNYADRFRSIRITRLESLGLSPGSRRGQAMLKAVVYHELGHCLHDYHGHRPVQEQVIMSEQLPERRFGELSQLIDEHFHMMSH